MAAKLTLMLLCLLSPLVAGADTLEVYGHLTGKTVLRPFALPALPDVMIEDLAADKTNASARIEKALAEQGLEVVQDGPHFVTPSKDFGDWPVFFHVDTPLTKSELLYAIETTFRLNNLAIIPVGDDQVRLGQISEAKNP